ncbi:LysR family transcriptional regulator [Rhodovarius crocodyli]|uniref:LysR family transcriptional regulator n=1 Tax=Rhodovarius crocodyli TaxID=1979269 RepID=A0A437MET6_9PROT|nr:LysR family transcriptional regulator [Rhodovarius crocodyli]RVT96132.1 LysR family transcriptional regulator [Rhodovarius crocodyli]
MSRRNAPSLPETAMLSLRVDLPQGRIGPGKVALLEAIGREGSISAAGRAMGMSYKRAWDLVDTLNQMLVEPAVAANPGGVGGGGASLTPAGEALIRDYRALEAAAEQAANPYVTSLAALMKG